MIRFFPDHREPFKPGRRYAVFMRLPGIALLATAFLIAGCTTAPPSDGLPPEDTRPADGEGFAPQSHFDEDVHDGLHLSGTLSDCDIGFCLDVLAENEGTTTYHVSDICVTPWSDAMKQRDHAVQHREPTAHCLAFGTAPFEGGDSMTTTFVWNKTLWDDDQQKYMDAPEDAYTWSVTFQAYEEADGAGPIDLTVEFPVIIGAT